MHPLSEKAKAMFGEAKSEKSWCETSVYDLWYFKMCCDISRWSPFTQETLILELMEAIVDAIRGLCYSRMLIAIGIISGSKRRLKKSFLEEIFNIWLYHQCCEFHLQCWWWWECKILLVKDFTTSPQMSFLRAEAWLGSRLGMKFWKPLEWLVHVIFHDIWTYELSQAWDLLLKILPICKTRATPTMMIILWSIVLLLVIEVLRELYYQES